MNIVVISKYARTLSSGHPTRQFLLSKYFARHGHDVLLISSVSNGVRTDLTEFQKDGFVYANIEQGVQNWVIDGPEIQLGMSLKRLWSMMLFELRLFMCIDAIVNRKPDVVLVSSLALPTILNGILIKWFSGARLVFEIRDIWPLTLVEIGGFSPKNPIIRLLAWIECVGYHHADLVVGTMPNISEHVVKISGENKPVEHVSMGYDPEFLDAASDSLPDNIQQKIPSDKFIVGYAGTIGIVNGIDVILETAALLESDSPDIHFVIMGEGVEKEHFQKTYAHLNNITWLPFLPKRYVNAFLLQCRVLAHPIRSKSIYRFGVSPNKWIDYMFSARPIICPFSGYRSIIDEAGCGVFIEPDNPDEFAKTIQEFASKSESELNEIGQRGQRFLRERLSYERLASDYIGHMRQLFN